MVLRGLVVCIAQDGRRKKKGKLMAMCVLMIQDGVYTYGLFIEGARWDKAREALGESHPKVLFSPAPLMWFKPVRRKDVTIVPHYNCPVYKTR